MKCVRELIHTPNTQTCTSKQHAKVFDLLVFLYCGYSRIELFQTPQPWATLGRKSVQQKTFSGTFINKKSEKGYSKLL